MTILSFTGTRKGMTTRQRQAVLWIVRFLNDTGEFCEAHHGMCIGADTEFHWIVRSEAPKTRIIGHPCTISTARELPLEAVDQSRPVYTPLIRNRRMALECNHLLATPKEASEVLRSGTWATVRYARALDKNTTIVAP